MYECRLADLDFMPWTLLWPLVAWISWREVLGPSASPGREELCRWRFLLVWIALPLAFFSLSAGKRGLYLVPIYPALALLCGAALQRSLSWPSSARRQARPTSPASRSRRS